MVYSVDDFRVSSVFGATKMRTDAGGRHSLFCNVRLRCDEFVYSSVKMLKARFMRFLFTYTMIEID